MSYVLEFTTVVMDDINDLRKSDQKAIVKLEKLLVEIMEHPRTGTGKPELLKYNFAGCYSRRISKKHRLIYQIFDEKVTVLILSIVGHYGDK